MSDGLEVVTFLESKYGNFASHATESGEYVPASVARDLLAKLAASQALVAKLIAAWPDDRDGFGPITYQDRDGSHYLETINGMRWSRECSDGPYPTREAAILAAIGEGGSS